MPHRYRKHENRRGMGFTSHKGGAGTKEKGGPINIRPFWRCPRELLLHNIYVSSQIDLVDPNMLYTNFLGTLGLFIMSFQLPDKGPFIYMGVQLAAWLGWLYIPSLRGPLTTPELLDAVKN